MTSPSSSPSPSNLSLIDMMHLPRPVHLSLMNEEASQVTPPQLSAVVKEVQDNQFLLDIPLISTWQKVLQPGISLKLQFGGEDSQTLKLHTAVKLVAIHPPTQCWVVAPMSFIDELLKRRKHIRIPMKFLMTVASLMNPTRAPVQALSLNLSGGGMRFISISSFLLGEHVKLQFKPETSGPEYEVEGEVVFCAEDDVWRPSLGYGWIIGVKFLNLSQKQEDAFVGICFRKELLQLRHLQSD